MSDGLALASSGVIDWVAGGLLLVLLTILIWVARYHRFHGKVFFLASVVGAILWLTAITLESVSMRESDKLVWAKIAWLGIGLLPTALYFFIDDYARARDRWRDRWRLGLVAGGPLAIFLLAASNSWHGLFYGPETGLVFEGPQRGQVIYDHGPFFYLAAVWLYFFVGAGIVVLLRGLRGAHRAHRSFFLAWLMVLVLPVAANLSYVIGGYTIFGLDPTAYAYALAMMAISGFIISDRMLDLRAVALEVMWQNSPSPLMIVMPDGRVASANPATLALCNRTRAKGQLAEWEPLAPHAARLRALDPLAGPISINLGLRQFEARALPIETPLERSSEMGRVLWLNDVSLRRELEARLASERDYLHLLMQTTMTGIIALDADGRVIFANPEAGKLTGRAPDTIPGMDHADLFPPRPQSDDIWPSCFATLINAGKSQRDAHVGFLRADGAARILSVNVAWVARPGIEARIVCAMADITEQLEAERALQSARDRAEAANRAKTEFLANMSHEIRTPLNGVLGMADLLAETALQDDQRAMLDTIRESGWGLLSLLNDILDLARVEAGRLELDPQPFDLSVLIAQLHALHGNNARAKGIGFDLRCAARPLLHRIGDETRIRQILHNLLGNAVKFTESGAVTLDVTPVGDDQILFRVSDTGIGMSQEQVGRIFQPFEQAEVGTARRFGGTGLGMTIVRRLVEMMDGEIIIDSMPGKGTQIDLVLSLPLDSAAQDAPPDPDPRDEPDSNAADLHGLRVLAADDNAANRKLLSLLMAQLGVDCQFARDGAEALALWQQEEFDLVLLDISMPVMDGLEALRAMQHAAAQTGAPPPRALAATANVMSDQIAAYQAAGFVGTLPKPFRRKDLVDALLRAKAAPDLAG
ncbi:MAG: histidine kinase N-terminal 7TM domain-containing protein [Roseinatronobacter sp.]